VITVLANRVAVVDRVAERRSRIDRRLQVIDPTSVVVPRSAEQQPEFLFRTEAMTEGSTLLRIASAAEDRVIASHSEKIQRREFTGRFGFHVDRAADAVAVNVRRQSLVDFDRFDKVSRDDVQTDLPDRRLW